jgi:hypothetical protein
VDIFKIVLGALLSIIVQVVYNWILNKREDKKIRLQKLEEIFLIVSEIIGQTLDKAIQFKNITPNSENKKMEISRLQLLISIYVPELEKDYKEFIELSQELVLCCFNKKSFKEFEKIQNTFLEKGNGIKEKIANMARKEI